MISGYWCNFRRSAYFRLLFLIMPLFGLSTAVLAQLPGWWQWRGVLHVSEIANDYAIANQGQLKHIAWKAAQELNEAIPGGAGEAINGMVAEWLLRKATNDYAPINIGQLKAVVAPFRERLNTLGYVWMTWKDPFLAKEANDYALANIGQVKAAFAFDVREDLNENGLPDWWELRWYRRYYPERSIEIDYQIALGTIFGEADLDEDGLSNVQEFWAGSDPWDFFNGIPPILEILEGDQQIESSRGAAGTPIRIRVKNAEGTLLVGAPLMFAVEQKADVSLASDYFADLWQDALTVRSGRDGIATVYTRLGRQGGAVFVSPARPGPEGSLIAWDEGGASQEPRRGIELAYYGRPIVTPLPVERIRTALSEAGQTVGVQVVNPVTLAGLAGVPVSFALESGDASLLELGEQPFRTDERGQVRIQVLPGDHVSVVRAMVGKQTCRFEVDQKIPGAIEIVGFSLKPGETRFPCDGVPVVYLSRPLPDSITVDPFSGQLVGPNGPPRGKDGEDLHQACMTLLQLVAISPSESQYIETVEPLEGRWRILPGRKAIAYIPKQFLSRYAFAFSIPQFAMRFQLNLNSECLPFKVSQPMQLNFSLATNPDFQEMSLSFFEKLELWGVKAKSYGFFETEAPPKVVYSYPSHGQSNVPRSAPIRIQWSQAIDPDTWGQEYIQLKDNFGEKIQFRQEYDYQFNVMSLFPLTPLLPFHAYHLTVSKELKNLSGVPLDSPLEMDFFTSAQRYSGIYGDTVPDNADPAGERIPVDEVFRIRLATGLNLRSLPQDSVQLIQEGDGGGVIPMQSVYNPLSGILTLTPGRRLKSFSAHTLVTRLSFLGDGTPGGSAEGIGADADFVFDTGAPLAGSDDEDGASAAESSEEPAEPEGTGETAASTPEPGTISTAAASAGGKAPSPPVTPMSVNWSDYSFRLRFVASVCIDGFEASNAWWRAAIPVLANLDSSSYALMDAGDPETGTLRNVYQGEFAGWMSRGAEALSSSIAFGQAIHLNGTNIGVYNYTAGAYSNFGRKIMSVTEFKKPMEAPSSAPPAPLSPLRAAPTYLCWGKYRTSTGAPTEQVIGFTQLPALPLIRVSHGEDRLGIGYFGFPREVVLSPVVVRDEDGESGPNGRQLVVSMSSPPTMGRWETPESFQNRLKQYYKAPFPRQAVAFIKARQLEPEMPSLTVSIPGAPQSVRGCWRLRVQYDRKNGLAIRSNGKLGDRTQPEDIVDLPGRIFPDRMPSDLGGPAENVVTYTETMSACDVWRISQSVEWSREIHERGFFGGEAMLYWANEGGGETLVAHFRIGGENPRNDFARSVIQQLIPGANPEGDLWFAYAIAKSETSEFRYRPNPSSEEGFYNQFRSNPKRIDIGFPAWNNDGDELPGGYGVFQVTGNVRNEKANIPRRQIWNWMSNVVAGGKLLRSKHNDALRALALSRKLSGNTKIPDLTVRGVLFSDDARQTMLDAICIKRFNGASKEREPGLDRQQIPGFLVEYPTSGDFCYWDSGRKQWHLSRFNRPFDKSTAPFNYVDRVCEQVE
ncbi:MAG: hypothetical protein RLZZ399_1937 [Verrucomicrobiota bacterium]